MGSFVEINDTLELTVEQGFPADIFQLEKHKKHPITLEDVKGKVFEFKNKPSARIFQNCKSSTINIYHRIVSNFIG